MKRDHIQDHDGLHVLISARGSKLPGWAREIWHARELLAFFIWRDVIVRYKQTAFGVAWAIIQPLGLMVVFATFLGHLAKVPSDGIDYPVFVYCGLVPWTFHNQALSIASNSLVANANLVSKMYFPRVLLPVAAVLSFIPDLLIGTLLLLVLALLFGISPSVTAFGAIAFAILGFLTVLGVSIWLSALNARYRDVKYAVPFLLQVWLFLTPVAYPASLVPERFTAVYSLNPMVTVVDGYRWAFIGATAPDVQSISCSVVAVVVILFVAVWYFRSVERSLADVI